MTPILRAALQQSFHFVQCALLGLFHPHHSFAKLPPQFSMCYSGHANCSGPFVFECSLCRQHGPSSIERSCALLGRFHPPNSFAKPAPRFSVRLRPRQSLRTVCFWMLGCGFLQLVEESLFEWRNEDVSCCQSCEQALQRTYGWAPRKLQSMLYLSVHCGDASVLHYPVPGMLHPQGMHSQTLSRNSASVLLRS